MAIKPEVAINIGSEFTGKKAFKQADTATQKLGKEVKNLAKSLGLAFSAVAIVRFARISIKAFNDQQKEIAQLTSALNSLNEGFRFTEVDKFLENMEDVTKVGGDKLIPAFSQLARVTEDVDKAQKLLGISLDISAGTGRDLTSVTAAISRAMSGNTAALGRLNVGLDKNLLAYGDLDDILDILEGKFKGSAARAVDTFEGRMKTLTIESDRAKEVIGGGLVDAITILGGSNGIDIAADSMKRLSDETANALVGLALLVKQVGIKTPDQGLGLANLATLIPVAGTYLGPLIERLIKKGELEAAQRAALGGPILDPAKEIAAAKNRAKIQAALDKANVKSLAVDKKKTAEQNKQLKIKKEQLKLDKAALILGKGEDVFDLDKIQIAAAILATQENIQRLGVNATDQQKLQLANDAQRLTVKQLMLDLEDAIAAKDVERATSLSKQLNTELAILGTLTGQTYKLGEIDKILARFVPKDLINLDNLDAAIRKLLEIAGSRFDFLSPIMPSQDRSGINDLSPDITSRYIAGDPEAVRAIEAHADAISMLAESELALADALFAESIRALDIATASVSPSALPSFGGFDPARFRMADNITINVNAGVIGNEDAVELAVQRSILSLERKGDPLRYTGGL